MTDPKLRSYSKYSGLAIQLVAVIVGLTFLGKYIDHSAEFKFPIFTVSLAIVGVFASLVLLIRGLK